MKNYIVFTATFNQFNASLLNKSINFSSVLEIEKIYNSIAGQNWDATYLNGIKDLGWLDMLFFTYFGSFEISDKLGK